MKSKIMLFHILLLIVCGHVLSSPTNLAANERSDDKGLEKLGIFKGNAYFQGTEQIFNFYNVTSVNEKEKPKAPKIPDGYTVVPGIGAYKLHETAKKWNEARNICVQEGAHLAVINSAQEEINVIQKIVKEKKIGSAWLGIHDLYQQGDWVTTLDVPINKIGYANWKPGEPNNYQNSNEHCVSYETSGLNDLNCNDHSVPFFCKIYLN